MFEENINPHTEDNFEYQFFTKSNIIQSMKKVWDENVRKSMESRKRNGTKEKGEETV